MMESRGITASQNVTSQPDFIAMSASTRSYDAADQSAANSARPACVALVPVVPSVQWARVPDLASPDSTFITHLIATTEHVPQTCTLRRATPADAQAAYRAHQRSVSGAGVRTRQTI
jgi:hypothetical protein